MTDDVGLLAGREALVSKLTAAGVPVDATKLRAAAYSYDASNYRVPPVAVVCPRNVDDVLAAVAACRETNTPLTSRGGGTSMAGNAIGPGLVLDFSRHMNRIRGIDEAHGFADVEPGVVLSVLTREAERVTHGRLTFAPDPSSKNRATIGGAVGNDACGNHSVRYGRTSDHVVELDVVTSDGARLTAFAGGIRASDPADRHSAARARELSDRLSELARANLASFRTELGRIPRQVSGYHLAHLLPEQGFNVARALVGSEGTCAVVVGARMRLVPKPASALLICLGYEDVVDAARDIGTILEFSPAAVEGIDQAIVDTMRLRRGADAVVGLPRGNAFLYVDLDGDRMDAVTRKAEHLLERLRSHGRMVDGRVVPDQAERAALWRVREDGAGLSSRPASGGESWPGWEDSAVAPENLADYLSDFRGLLRDHALTGIMYGHFGAGCMHVRVTYDLRTDAGREVFRQFTAQAAALVVRHGGTLSGEHGDGRARSEFLPVMYSPAVMDAFGAFRRVWDEANLLNPGSVTSPDPIDANLALDGVPQREWRTNFAFHPTQAREAGVAPWTHAVQACIGVGRCRSDAGGVMCPSFRATGDEKDSTRGRARVLQEMVRGADEVRQGWSSEEVRAALDLCLACKACSSDCPAGVDMATYRSEFLSHYYAGRRRPLSHLSLGWLPAWLKITAYASAVVNLVLATPLGKLVARLGGVTTHRTFPKFASRRTLRRELRSFELRPEVADVILFVDSFTKGFRPEVAGAAARVVSSTGRQVACEVASCCGLTWVSTGQLGVARKVMASAVERLDNGRDTPIVVVEPSCAAALKKDAPELLRTEAAARVAARVRSFAEAVPSWVEDGWRPPAMPSRVAVQTHCHEYSTVGAHVQRRALTAMGVTDVVEATGCCGVAGNFGFEAEHFDMSMKVAQQALAPTLARTRVETPVLADGFSCSMQVKQLNPHRRTFHLAELADPLNQAQIKLKDMA
ncbi:MAG TPA: FAD-binding and (Fe-S)-binding domain-containing protein [Nonomuraea sp.]|nr:FAD-binding and (Fe-S)-binding domain-containing protein [Nonomuraea sp.]